MIEVSLREGRCLVTLEVDFSSPFLFPPEPYAGIAVIRLPRRVAPNDLQAPWATSTAALTGDLDLRRKALDRRTASHPGVSAGEAGGSRAMRSRTRDRPRDGNQGAGSRPPVEGGTSPDRMRPPDEPMGRARTGCPRNRPGGTADDWPGRGSEEAGGPGGRRGASRVREGILRQLSISPSPLAQSSGPGYADRSVIASFSRS